MWKNCAPMPFDCIIWVIKVDASFSRYQVNMIAFCSLLARRHILCRWKDSCPPTYGDWIREVMCYIHLEKIRYIVKGSVEQFYNTWMPFMSYFESVSPDNFV